MNLDQQSMYLNHKADLLKEILANLNMRTEHFRVLFCRYIELETSFELHSFQISIEQSRDGRVV